MSFAAGGGRGSRFNLPPTSRRRPAAGFTLVEVLVALGITALVAALSYASLSQVLSGVESLRAEGTRVSEINRAWTILSRDLRQFAPRPVLAEAGRVEPSLWGGAGSGLAFTRSGWHNPNRQPRSTLQRVRYQLEDGALWRESYAVLDRVDASEPQRVRLLPDVDYFDLAFLPRGQALRPGDINTDGWPDAWGVNASTAEPTPPPRALEVRLTLGDWGEVRWLYNLPSGAPDE